MKSRDNCKQKKIPLDYGGGEDTPTITSSGSYWGKIKRPKQDIIQRMVVSVKIKQGAEGYHEKYFSHRNATTKLLQTFGA